MPLFHPHVIEKYTGSIIIQPGHARILSKWDKYIHSDIIKKTKETALYDSFSQGILQKILQYKPALDDPSDYTLEQNQTIGKGEVEYALGHFGSNKKIEIIAPLELKSARTNLDAVIPSKNRTPVQQAWEYATELKETKWVLVSNYLELRLYAVGGGKKNYEVFKLDNLTDPQEYAHFLLLLSADHLLSDFTLNLLNESEQTGKEITNKFYSEYKKIREKIIITLKNDNRNTPLQEIIQHSQNILNRVLFAAFAEGKGLLPPKTIAETCKQHKFNPRPMWENFIGLFNAIDKGSTSLHIPGYNGGLFQYDPKLDSLKISDELCNQFMKFSEYDFTSDVSVNILGHILEQSITDLEEIKISTTEKKISFENEKNTRKKRGVYYTPPYITQYIVEQSVGGWLSDRKKEIFNLLQPLSEKDYVSIRRKKKGQIIYNKNIKEHIQAWENYKKILSNIRVLDPACGSGAFLIEVYDYLFREGEAINNELSKLKGGQTDLFRWDQHIIAHNIYGVDINHEARGITKLSLWLKTATQKEKLICLDDNIKLGDSLIDDPTVAGKLAFEWEKEFPAIMADGGFDVVIGNPPYVFSREKIHLHQKKYFTKHYQSAQYQVNTYLLFIEKSLSLVKKNTGHINFIVPNTWLMTSSAEKLRKLILDNCIINRITNLSGTSFENVNVETIILDLSRNSVNEGNEIDIFQNTINNQFKLSHTKKQSLFNVNKGFEFQIFIKENDLIILDKINKNSVPLDEVAVVKAGLQAYEVGKGIPKQTKSDVKNRIYDYSYKYDKNTYPYLDGEDVRRYFHMWKGTYLKYGDNLAAPRSFNIFYDDVIIVREIAGAYPHSIIATFSPKDEVYLFNRSNIAILNSEGSKIKLKYILAILCSTLTSYYFMRTTAKAERKMFPKIILKDLKKFPIKVISEDQQLPFIEKVNIILLKNTELRDLSVKFLELLKSEFSITTLTNKLENWHTLSFDDFMKELKKYKVSLSLIQKKEWMEYFQSQNNQALKLKTIIEKTDHQINQLTYELYAFTKKEIESIETISTKTQ